MASSLITLISILQSPTRTFLLSQGAQANRLKYWHSGNINCKTSISTNYQRTLQKQSLLQVLEGTWHSQGQREKEREERREKTVSRPGDQSFLGGCLIFTGSLFFWKFKIEAQEGKCVVTASGSRLPRALRGSVGLSTGRAWAQGTPEVFEKDAIASESLMPGTYTAREGRPFSSFTEYFYIYDRHIVLLSCFTHSYT